MYYSATGTGYISTPSFAIPNTGILTIEAWMKSVFNASYQSITGDNAGSTTVGFSLLNRASNGSFYYYADGASQAYVYLPNFFQNFDNQ